MPQLLAEGGTTITDIMSTAVTSIVSNCMTMVSTVLPIAMGVIGMMIAVGFGLKVVKKFVK